MNPPSKQILRIERYIQNLATRDKLHSHVDLLLHPRRPPFVRTLPFVESLSLSSAEESAEETETRRTLDLAFGNGEICSITSKPQTHHEPEIQSFPNSPQVRALPTFVELQPPSDTNDNRSSEVSASSVAPVLPPLQAVPDVPAGSPLSSTQKGPMPSVYVAPMVVDESDHEEVPAIDLGSDSDA